MPENNSHQPFDVDLAFDFERRQAQSEMNDYLSARPFKGKGGRIHTPDGSFAPNDYFDQAREAHYDDSMGSYEELTLSELADELAYAEVTEDRTRVEDLSDVLISKMEEFAEEKGLSGETFKNPDGTEEDAQTNFFNRVMKLKDSKKLAYLETNGKDISDKVKNELAGKDSRKKNGHDAHKTADSDVNEAASEAETEDVPEMTPQEEFEDIISNKGGVTESAEARAQFKQLLKAAQEAAEKGNNNEALRLNAKMAEMLEDDQLGLGDEEKDRLSIVANDIIEEAKEKAPKLDTPGDEADLAPTDDDSGDNSKGSPEPVPADSPEKELSSEEQARRINRLVGVARQRYADRDEAVKNATRLFEERAKRLGWSEEQKQAKKELLHKSLNQEIGPDVKQVANRSAKVAKALGKRNLRGIELKQLIPYQNQESRIAGFARRDAETAEREALVNYWRMLKKDGTKPEDINKELTRIVDYIHGGKVNLQEGTIERTEQVRGPREALRSAWSNLRNRNVKAALSDTREAGRFSHARNKLGLYVGATALIAGAVGGVIGYAAAENNQHDVPEYIEKIIDDDEVLAEAGVVDPDLRELIIENPEEFEHMTENPEEFQRMMQWRNDEIDRRFSETVFTQDENGVTATSLPQSNWDAIRHRIAVDVDKQLVDYFESLEDNANS